MNLAFPGPGAVPRDILLVDPSLFTAPYDAALSGGLEEAGAQTLWATRQLRCGEEDRLGERRSRRFFYPISDGPRRRTGAAWRALKGIEHALGMRRLLALLPAERIDLVHFQWLLLPAVDREAIRRIRRRCPVVLTVHDSTPFNGKAVNAAQRAGMTAALQAADRLIVHTGRGRDILAALGIDPGRIVVVPHGLLAGHRTVPAESGDGRWRIVLIGKLQDYKGIDVLIEALGLLDAPTRAKLHVTIAGEPLIPLEPLIERARALGLMPGLLDLRPRRQTEAELEALIAGADAFVFPYRAIEASGVLFLVAPARRWIIASDLGAFSDLIGRDRKAGSLVPPGDPAALAQAIAASIGCRPERDLACSVPGWDRIGAMTRQVYDEAARDWRRERAA